jgi:tetratricopeptide (TPR) repeat protein
MCTRAILTAVMAVAFNLGSTGLIAAADEAPDWSLDGLIAQLGNGDPDVRRIAALRLKNLDGTHLDGIEQAISRQDLTAEARNALTESLPTVRYRARRLKLSEEVRAYERRSLLDGYQRSGAKDPRWDGLVKDAITLFSAASDERVPPEQVAAAFNKAIDAGCTDPLVQFLYARAEWAAGPADRDALLTRQRQATLSLPNTKYAAEFSWRAAVRYLEQSRSADQEVIAIALEALPKALAETGRPNRDVADFIDVMHTAVARGSSEEQAFEQIYPVYARSRPPTDPGPHLYKGRRYITWAWEARGSGWANTVAPQGWKLFGERLAVAREALEQAWKVDPQESRAAADMIRVLMGESGSKAEMEMWFRRAMDANPDNREACSFKLRFLFPRWHGTPFEMEFFGRQCLATQNWWGPIPTILVEAHEEIARCGIEDPKAYFARPQVWKDIESVYRSFLEVYPDSHLAPWYRSKLAKWACDCQQWDAARKVFAEIGDQPDLSVFRSMAVYNYYRKKAAKKSDRAQQVYADPTAD